MPAKDIIHDKVKAALIKDGWTITHDPFFIRLEQFRTYADLGAERPFAAQKGAKKIAVEVKSFVGRSPMYDLEQAIGQFSLYKALLTEVDPERQVYMAVGTTTYATLFDTVPGRVVIRELGLALCVIKLEEQEVTQWIN